MNETRSLPDEIDILCDHTHYDLEIVDRNTPDGQRRIDEAMKSNGFCRRVTKAFWERYLAAVAERDALQRAFDAFPRYRSEWRAHLTLDDAEISTRPVGSARLPDSSTRLPNL